MGKSFWNKLGQGVSRGLEKAKQVGASIGEQAEQRLDRGAAKRALRAAYEKLGEAVARIHLDAEEADTDGGIVTGHERDVSVEAALEEVRHARAALARFEPDDDPPERSESPES